MFTEDGHRHSFQHKEVEVPLCESAYLPVKGEAVQHRETCGLHQGVVLEEAEVRSRVHKEVVRRHETGNTRARIESIHDIVKSDSGTRIRTGYRPESVGQGRLLGNQGLLAGL